MSSSLWGSHQLRGGCCFARPWSVYVFFFVCLSLHHSGVVVSGRRAAALLNPRVHLSLYSYVSIFICLRVCLPTSSSISIFVCLWQCHSAMYVNSVCGISCGMSTGFCYVFPYLTSKSFGHVFPHIKHLHWHLISSEVVLNSLRKKCVEVHNYLVSCCVEIYIFSNCRGNTYRYMSKCIKVSNECVNKIYCVYLQYKFLFV